MLPLRQSSGPSLQAPFRGVINHFKLAVGVDFASQRIQRDEVGEQLAVAGGIRVSHLAQQRPQFLYHPLV
ncbi:MAG: hypothetical protein QOJ15_1664 [Bradyrhizobium sp.]|nr:hypothetical protein [Bradyrhizobium sp.]